MVTLSEDLASLRISREKPPSSGRWLKIGGAIAAVLLLAGVYQVGKPALEGSLRKPKVGVTEILSVSPAQDAVNLTATGYVTAQRVARVGAKVTGRLAHVNIEQGDAVKAGQVLFTLDAADQKSALAVAQADVVAAQARVQAKRANLAEIEVQWKRQAEIVKNGAAAASTAVDLEARVKALGAQVDAAAADVQAKRAQATTLQVGLENLTIVAPMDGTVLNMPAQVGDITAPSAPLMELADFSTLVVETDVPEARLDQIRDGGPAEVVLDSAPSQRYRGEVVEVSPKVNRAKATATVKVRFVDAPARLLPDMGARVSFLARALDAKQLAESTKVMVPSSAVVQRDGGSALFVIDEGKVRLERISVGEGQNSMLELMSGPPVGTRIVNEPPPALRDGQAIEEGRP